MDSTLQADFKNVYGIDLSDYYLDKSSFNPLIYIHKKNVPKETADSVLKRIPSENSNDKGQQFDYDRLHTETYKTKVITSENKDALINQTIKFAKDIIPITIPPSKSLNNPCCYTVQPCKKSKRKLETQEHLINSKYPINATFDKERSKLTSVKQRKCNKNKDSISVTTATPASENNTIDDINENQSLSYNLSELSEPKLKKETSLDKNKIKNIQNTKIVASESFEAIATEYINTSAESKIKIHLMNENDKHLLCENIRSPVLKAIREYFHELNRQNDLQVNTEIQHVNNTIRCHEKKLDNILEKLASIENKLDLLAKPKKSPKIEVIKASKLEELGQDIDKEDSSEEELACVNFSSKLRGNNTTATPSYNEKDAERDYQSVDNLARGENIPEYAKSSTSQLAIKPERSNRIPARFCWTDTAMK